MFENDGAYEICELEKGFLVVIEEKVHYCNNETELFDLIG